MGDIPEIACHLFDEGLLQFHANSRIVLLTISAEIITDRS